MVILSNNPKASVTLSLRRGAWCAYRVWSGVWLFLGHANKYYYRDFMEFWNLLKNINEKCREEIDMHLIGLHLHISYVAGCGSALLRWATFANLQFADGSNWRASWSHIVYLCARAHSHMGSALVRTPFVGPTWDYTNLRSVGE